MIPRIATGSAKTNGREPKTCLGRVFNYKLGCFEDVHETHVCGHTPTSIVENSAQVSSFYLKFVHDNSENFPSGLYYKSLTIIIYDHNDSSQYYNTMIMTVSYTPNLTQTLASVVNYDHKWRSKLKRKLQS